MRRQSQAYLFALCAISLWATAATAFKITLRHLSPLEMLFFSSMTSCVCLGIISLLHGGLSRLRVLSASDFRASMLLGFFNPFLYYVLLFKAYSLIPAQQALTLNNIWPIMLVILSVPLLGQRLSLRSFPAFLLCFAGVLIIATGGKIFSLSFDDPAGVACALSSSTVWALYWIYNVRDHRDDRDKLFLNFCFGTMYAAVYYCIVMKPQLPSTAGLAGAVYIGLFEMGVTFFFWLKALSFSESTAKIGIMVYLTPVTSLVLLALITGEQISMATVAGLVAIIAGIFIQNPPWKMMS